MAQTSLVQSLLGAASIDAKARLEGEPELAELLASAVDRGRRAWPKLKISDEIFASYAGARAPLDAVGWLRELRAEELFLTCGCVCADPAALTAFREFYLPGVDRALGRLKLNAQAREDVLQRLEIMLLVADGARPPQLAGYTGAGELRGWVRVAAVRLAMRARAKSGDDGPTRSAPGQLQVAIGDQEIEYLKAAHGEAFGAAFSAAFHALSPREQLLLTQHHHHGATTEELATTLNVHKATAARWLVRARQRFLDNVREELLERLKVGRDTLTSIGRALQSDLSTQMAALFSRMDPKNRP